jgi:hypothetical protein
MKTFKQFIAEHAEQESLDEGLRQKVIGGAALVAGIMGALGHSSNEADYHKHLEEVYGEKNPSVSKIVAYHTHSETPAPETMYKKK